jgi:hypothetical protein
MTIGWLCVAPLQASGLEPPALLSQTSNLDQILFRRTPLVKAPKSRNERPESLSPAWAVLQLRSIAERYGCGSTELGASLPVQINSVMSREQAALELHACEAQMNERIAASDDDEIVPLKNIRTMFKLQEEFMPELNGIRGQLDSLVDRSI